MDNSINILNNINNNSEGDSNIGKLQENLLIMGFDITMINKIISIFKIKTENEALDYLIKSEDGMWNHPFIPKEKEEKELNNSFEIFNKPKLLMSSVINKLKITDSKGPKQRISNSVNVNANTEEHHSNAFNMYICDICGELKEFHKIQNYSIKSENNNNSENHSLRVNKHILIDDEDEFNNFFNNNNNIYNIDNNNININNINNSLNNINHSLNNNENENEDDNMCPICMGEYENPLEMPNCRDKFCFECFHTYIVNLINNNNIDKIPCPKKNCFNKELSEEFFSQYLSEQEFFKFRQFKSQNQIARDPKKIFCPLCDSYAVIKKNIEQYESNNPNYKKSNLTCMNGHIFCSCGRTLHENDCYKDEKEFKEMIKKEKIKRCPKCGFLIKKNKGCNHMTCGNPICKYEFCWLCMNEAIPNHYDIGECAGKQFIDPDSWEYWIEQNCPYLIYFFIFMKYLLIIIWIIFCCVILPGILLCFLSWGFIMNDYSESFVNHKVRDVDFIISLLLCFPCQSIIYNIFIGIYLIIINIKYVIIVFIFVIIISLILVCVAKYLECCCFRRNVDRIELNEIELDNIIIIDNNLINNNNNNNPP